jgi:transposase-like protein
MNCPYWKLNIHHELKKATALAYKQYYCRHCDKQYNARTGTVFNFIQYRTEVVMLAVHYYYRFKNSLDDVVELMAIRGIHLSHQTVHNWTQTLGVELGIKLRERRKGKMGKKWHADSTYLQVEGRWCYFYRAIDKEGNLVDIYLSDVRDQAAAEAFFNQAKHTTGIIPIKSRLRVMKGFKNIFSGLIFCTGFEEIRQFFRMKNKTRSERRRFILPRIQDLKNLLA